MGTMTSTRLRLEWLLSLSAVVLAVAGCASSPAPVKPAKMSYPYKASDARKQQIIEAHSRIKQGMTIAQMHELAGEPDVVRSLYEPRMKDSVPKGHTHWYYLQIDDPDWKRNESLMRVSTDLEGIVISVDAWGWD